MWFATTHHLARRPSFIRMPPFLFVTPGCSRTYSMSRETGVMKCLRYGAYVCLLAFLELASVASASSWSCQADKHTREVVVFYPKAPARLPCKVYYAKPEENVLPRALWEATNTHNYCENRAKELVEKLSSMGWRCLRDSPE